MEVEYNSTLATFNERLAKWDDAQAAYEAIVEEAELDDFINSAADYREKAVKGRDELIKNWINSQNKENQDNDKHSTRTSNVTPQVNLPRIALPKFSGDVLKFTPFWQQFKSCVDDLDYPVLTKFNKRVRGLGFRCFSDDVISRSTNQTSASRHVRIC